MTRMFVRDDERGVTSLCTQPKKLTKKQQNYTVNLFYLFFDIDMTKNCTALLFFILCSVPSWATGPSGFDTQDSAKNNTEPLAAAAPPVAMAAPHKVVAKPFVLDNKTLQTLQSGDGIDKQALLAKAARAVSLHIDSCV